MFKLPSPLSASYFIVMCVFFPQINILLNFSEGEDCPCPEEIQEELTAFHEELRLHCGRVQLLSQSFDEWC